MKDLRAAGCDLLTLGQYLAPSRQHHPVVRYVPPAEFDLLAARAQELGFAGVLRAPGALLLPAPARYIARQ